MRGRLAHDMKLPRSIPPDKPSLVYECVFDRSRLLTGQAGNYSCGAVSESDWTYASTEAFVDIIDDFVDGSPVCSNDAALLEEALRLSKGLSPEAVIRLALKEWIERQRFLDWVSGRRPSGSA